MRSRANKKTIAAELKRVAELAPVLQQGTGTLVQNAVSVAMCFGAFSALEWLLGGEMTPSQVIWNKRNSAALKSETKKALRRR